MRKTNLTKFTAVLLILVLIFSLGGCGRVDNTIAEPDEITVEYLYGEYAEQLIRDGAEIITGTVMIEKNENGMFDLTVEHMVIVESDITEAGYYVADSNVSTAVPMDSEARIAYAAEEEAEPEIITVDELLEIVTAENYDPLEEGSEKLFDVYIMGGSALMALEKEMPAITE